MRTRNINQLYSTKGIPKVIKNKLHERLGNYSQAELEYQEIINDYPDNPWGYIGWGDMNFFSNSITVAKAKKLYFKALEVAGEDKEMVSIIEGRLDGLNEE